MINQQVKTYANAQQFQRDAKRMAQHGWQVSTSTVGGYRKASLLSWLLFGIFNLFRKSKARDITVTYIRASTATAADGTMIAAPVDLPEIQVYTPRVFAWWIPALWLLATLLLVVTRESGISIVLFLAAIGSACYLDWDGVKTLRGWVHPETMQGNSRYGYIAAWVLLCIIIFPAYAIRVLLQSYRQKPASQVEEARTE